VAGTEQPGISPVEKRIRQTAPAAKKQHNGSYETVLEEKVPEKISISATRWPSFSAFGFAAGGTITLETEYYITKVVVSPIGRIRQTEILKK
jgi:hypothetical protein